MKSTYSYDALPRYSQQNFNAYAVYKDNGIYIFGGLCNNSAKFSLSKNRWIQYTSTPINLGNYTFGASFKNYILLGSTSSDKIIYYDTEIDSYCKISSLDLTKLSAKMIFVENETVYLIGLSQYIYKSADHLVTWVNIGRSSPLTGNGPIITTPVTYNQKIYFVSYYGIYSFDLIQKNIEKLKALIKP